MWNLGNEHGQYIISITFIASTTKKAELLSSDTKNVHLGISALWRAPLTLATVESALQDPYKCRVLWLCHMYLLGAYVLDFVGEYHIFWIFLWVENVLSANGFWFCTQSRETSSHVK